MSFKVKNSARPEKFARFERRTVNGMSRVYPTNPNAVTLTKLTHKSSVNETELKIMRMLGYEVIIDEAGVSAIAPTLDARMREEIIELIGEAVKQLNKQGGEK